MSDASSAGPEGHPAAGTRSAVEPAAGALVMRHRLSTRIWHWLNALVVIVLLMSGLMIFNAHPRLYWGVYGANTDRAWFQIGSTFTGGYIDLYGWRVPTTGVLGVWSDPAGHVQRRAFPWWATIPGHYDLASARLWHLAFAWALVVPGLGYWVWSVANRHVSRDLLPRRGEFRPGHIWQDVKDHARLRFPTGPAALKYNILQKLAYLGVLFVALPVAVLTGLAMSPGLDAAWPWLLDLFGGRASARSIHFIAATALALFVVVHLVMVVLAGPWNEVRSMVTGRFRLPVPRGGHKP